MRTKIGLALLLAAALPFGCKCLSSEPTEPPDESIKGQEGVRNPYYDPSRSRVLDPKKARLLKFGDRLRLSDRAQPGVGQPITPEQLAKLPQGAAPASQPATQAAASRPASQPAAATRARPPASVKAQFE